MVKQPLSRSGNLALILLGVFILVALLAPFLAGDRPIICKTDNTVHFPILERGETVECNWALYPVIRYRFDNIDENNAGFLSPLEDQSLAPGQQRHWLGTDQLGRDVASGMIHGSRVALLTGSLSMLLALIIGLSLGLISGFYGNSELKIKGTTLTAAMLTGLYLTYSGVYFSFLRNNPSSWFLITGFLLLLLAMNRWLFTRVPWLVRKRTLPVDRIQSVFVEIFQSLPGSFIVLILVSLFTRASLYNVILIIGLLRWPMIARYVRAEMLKIRASRYIEASRALGMTDWRIILRHALPASLTPVIVSVSFGFASAVLLESALSFLGIGLPADHVSFGSMLAEARKNYEAWWMALFPGSAIFFLVFIFNHLGDRVSRFLEKK